MDLVFTTGSTNNAMQCVDVAIIANSVRNSETFTMTLTTANPETATVGNAVTTITIQGIG